MSTIDELNAEIKKLEDEILMLRKKIDEYEAQLAPGQQTALGIPAAVIGTLILEKEKQISTAKGRIRDRERQIAAYKDRQGSPTALTNFAFIRMC
jgi:predicted  nucleic acid-binding Zn-ribbon protein